MNYLNDAHKVVEYIEANLDRDIYLDDIVKIANLSKFHFLRIFKALTGNTPSEYIRKRRLTNAAYQLIETRASIIDIAFYYRYESQEAFTRAFRAMYGLTPKAYRQNRIHFTNINKIILDENVLDIKTSNEVVVPTVVSRGSFQIIGMKYKGKNEKDDIPRLWNEFLSRLHEVDNTVNTELSYGYEEYTTESKETGEFSYVAAVEAGEGALVPWGMSAVQIPASRYAVFAIPAIVEDAQKTVLNIYTKYLPQLGLIPYENYDFELFDKSFIPNNSDSRYFLYIPIKA